MQAAADALAPHPGKIIKQFSAYEIPELLKESEPKLTLLKNGMKKQHPVSELFAKVPLRGKLSLFPAHYNPKLVLSDRSCECQCVQGCPRAQCGVGVGG